MFNVNVNKHILYLGILFLYCPLWLLDHFFSITFPIQILGFFLLLYVFPSLLKSFFSLPKYCFLDSLLFNISTFFTLCVPLYYLLNKLGYRIDDWHIFGVILFFIIIVCFQKKDSITISSSESHKWVKQNWLLLIALAVYCCIHILNFHFYQFIPEGDGYLDMVKIDDTISTGFIAVEYRSLFILSLSLLSDFSHISSYNLFSSWMIVVQAALIIALYQFSRRRIGINSFQIGITLLMSLSIPVLNMEIDYVRPQSLLIILLPLYLYFFSIALENGKSIDWIIVSLIPLIGIGYHQFFLFICLSHFLALFIIIRKRSVEKTTQQKMLYIISALFLLSLFINIYLLFLKKTPFFQENFYYLNTIVVTIRDFHWHWWFLNNYPADAQPVPMGWSGIDGAAKYYAYYLSPVILVTFIALLYIFILRKFRLKNQFIIYTLTLLILFLSFAEVLPRLNRPLIPERFWLPLDILLVFYSVFLWKEFTGLNKVKVFSVFLVLFSVIGLGGSFYVAKGKSNAIISMNDIVAINWIKQHTDHKALFITQASNDALFAYYLNKPIFSNIPAQYWIKNNFRDYLRMSKNVEQTNREMVSCIPEMDIEQGKECIKKIQMFLTSHIDQGLNSIPRNLLETPIYVYYSEDRFKTIFAQREWWRIKNYADLNIEDLNNLYTPVYNSGGVHIWEVK